MVELSLSRSARREIKVQVAESGGSLLCMLCKEVHVGACESVAGF
jgi:hypothetical protein